MAVYRRDYHKYAGKLTSPTLRFLILPRYAFQQVFHSRLLTVYFALCILVSQVATLIVYLRHNVTVLQALQLPVAEILTIDGSFFLQFLSVQCGLGFILAAVVGPGLVSPDLANNALPLYLGRPFSRAEYVLGKACVLVVLLSLITWIPLAATFLLQGHLEGMGWAWDNLRIGLGVLAGSWLWIAVVTLLSLALSAWVKWRPVAGALLFGIFLAAAGFGAAVNEILYTKWGYLLDLSSLLETIWRWLFQVEGSQRDIPVWSAFASLLTACGLCLLLLRRKVRAYEVVRS